MFAETSDQYWDFIYAVKPFSSCFHFIKLLPGT